LSKILHSLIDNVGIERTEAIKKKEIPVSKSSVIGFGKSSSIMHSKV